MPSGALYIAERTGFPLRSTMFWTPDQPLERDTDGKRIRYRYPTSDGGRTLTFVGFQDPIEVIPAGALLRVSLAHWWKPRDAPPEQFLAINGVGEAKLANYGETFLTLVRDHCAARGIAARSTAFVPISKS